MGWLAKRRFLSQVEEYTASLLLGNSTIAYGFCSRHREAIYALSKTGIPAKPALALLVSDLVAAISNDLEAMRRVGKVDNEDDVHLIAVMACSFFEHRNRSDSVWDELPDVMKVKFHQIHKRMVGEKPNKAEEGLHPDKKEIDGLLDNENVSPPTTNKEIEEYTKNIHQEMIRDIDVQIKIGLNKRDACFNVISGFCSTSDSITISSLVPLFFGYSAGGKEDGLMNWDKEVYDHCLEFYRQNIKVYGMTIEDAKRTYKKHDVTYDPR